MTTQIRRSARTAAAVATAANEELATEQTVAAAPSTRRGATRKATTAASKPVKDETVTKKPAASRTTRKTTKTEAETASAPVEPPSKSSSRPTRTNARKAYAEAPVDEVIEEEAVAPAATTTRGRRGAKVAASPAKPTATATSTRTSRAKKAPVEAAIEEEEEEPVPEEPPKKPATKSRARATPAKKTTTAAAAASTRDEPPKRATRARKRLLSSDSDQSVDEQQEVVAAKSKAPPAEKPAASKKKRLESKEAPLEPIAEEAAATSTSRRPTRAARKPKAAEPEPEPMEEDSAAPVVATKKAPARRGGRAAAKVKDETVNAPEVKKPVAAPRRTRKTSKTETTDSASTSAPSKPADEPVASSSQSAESAAEAASSAVAAASSEPKPDDDAAMEVDDKPATPPPASNEEQQQAEQLNQEAASATSSSSSEQNQMEIEENADNSDVDGIQFEANTNSAEPVSERVQSELVTQATNGAQEMVDSVKQNGTVEKLPAVEPVEGDAELESGESNGYSASMKRKREDQVETEDQRKRPRGDWITGDLFTFGEQLVGELGPREKMYKEEKLKRNEPSRVKLSGKAARVACGAYHTLVITDDGELVSFGCNDDGPLGRITAKPASEEGEEEASDSDDDEDYEEKMCAKVLPVKGEIKGKLIKVTAGDMHSAALDDEGRVYIWGNLKDDSNKIGLFTDDERNGSDYLPTREPRQIDLEGRKVVDIASGSHHFLMLTEDGQVFSLGEGSKGQLGRIAAAELGTIATDRDLFIKPSQVIFSSAVSISRVFAGQWSSFALDKSGVLYAWGLNNYFQLGFRTTKPVELVDQDTSLNSMCSLQAELTPVQVPTPPSITEVVAVACGQQHVAVLDIDGHIYTAGSVHYGKLGHGKEILEQAGEGAAIDQLRQIPQASFGNDRIAHVECGDFSAFAITETGRLFAWGQGSLHIGTDENEDLYEPTLIKGKYAEAICFQTGSSGSQFGAWIATMKSSSN